MKKWKVLLVIFVGLVAALFGYANRESFLSFYDAAVMQNYVPLIILSGFLLAFPTIYYIGKRLDFKAKMWSIGGLFGGDKPARILSQERRHQKIKEWFESNYSLVSYIREIKQGDLTLVWNKITPFYNKAARFELAVFTTEKAYADRRIGVSEIPDDKLFFAVYDCHTNEIELPPEKDMRMAWEFTMDKFTRSIPREPKALEEEIRKRTLEVIGTATGEKILSKGDVKI